MNNQCTRVLLWLKEGKTLTQIQALEHLGILRLASRVNDLNGMGHNVKSRMVKVKNRFGADCRVAEYSL